jgi:hypothetical protein
VTAPGREPRRRARGVLNAIATRWSPRRAVGVLLASAAVAGLVVPVHKSAASWNDVEWSGAGLGTSSFACGTDLEYTSTASSRFLSGSLAGTDLDDLAAVAGVALAKESTAPAAVEPVDAPALGPQLDPVRAAHGNPLQIGLLDDALGLDLTGLSVGLPAGSTGAVNQVARVAATGESTAAAGLVSDSGGVLVTQDSATAELPGPAALDLSSLLPPVSGVAGTGLEVGAVGSSAQLEGCRLLEEDAWGATADAVVARTGTTVAAVDAEGRTVTRDYGIASLDLRVDSPLAGSLVTAVQRTVTDLDATVAALAGPDGALSKALRQNIVDSLTGGLRLGTVTADVSLGGVDLGGAVRPLLSEELSDGTVTVDLASGSIRVDLAHLLGDDVDGLNDLPPNTEIVLDAELLDGIAVRVGALLDTWTARVTSALTTAVGLLRLTVALDADLRLLTVPLVQLNIRVDTGLAALSAGRAPVTVGTTLLGLDLGLATGLVDALVAGLTAGLPAVLTSTLAPLLTTIVGSLGTTLAAIVAPVLTAVGSVIGALPSLLSLRVNVQAESGGGRAGTTVDTGSWSVTALHVGLGESLLPGGLGHLDLAKSVVGPNSVDLTATPAT